MFHHLGKEIMARLFKLFLLHLFFFLGASVFTSKEEVDKMGMGKELQGSSIQDFFSPLSSSLLKDGNSQPLVVSPPETDIVVTMDWHRTQQR